MLYSIKGDQIVLRVLAKPNAKKTCLLSVTDQGLHISIHAKPHQGEANKELIRFLSVLLKIPKTKIILLKGDTSKFKAIQLPNTQAIELALNDLMKLWSVS